ncbi:MAG: MFS transporter [Parachlamydiaceae bacterium]|nr:MFS transporter [Parachlamydiaceae bacterium]
MRKESIAVYSSGLIQGICLVTFPAASTILTSPDAFNFSSTAYGSLFISQTIFALFSTAMNPRLCQYFSSKSVFIFGLIANLLSMVLMAFSVMATKRSELAHFILVVATALLGAGFGLTVPTLNAMTALLFPAKIDSMLLLLNALLGVGSALAPIFMALFVAFGFWWELPLILAGLIAFLILYSVSLTLPGEKIPYRTKSFKQNKTLVRFRIFGAFAFLYGTIETLNANWVSIYMKTSLHATHEIQALALTAFWGMVTVGRFVFAAFDKSIRERFVYQLSPFICAAGFLLLASLKDGESTWAVFASGLMGFGCSTLLPLTVGFGTQQFKSIAGAIPGMILTYYLIGYGIAAFGVGPLQEFAQIQLREIYYFGAFIAMILGLISIGIVKTKPKEM